MITKLQIKNFLGISEVEITPDNKLNVITGKNGQGKTSILKAIEFAFKGKIGRDIEVINSNSNKAEIYIDLDKFSISRVKTSRFNEVKVENEEGFEMKDPQKYLNEIIGDFSFNPIEFTFLNEKEKTEYLLKILDIKLTKKQIEEATHLPIEIDSEAEGLALLDEATAYYYEERKLKNREIKNKEGALKEFACYNKEVDQIKLRKFSAEKLLKKREEYHNTRVEYEHAKNEKIKKAELSLEIGRLKEMLKQAEDKYKSIKDVDLDEITERGKKIKAEVDAMEAMEKEFNDFKEYQKIEAAKQHLEDEAKELDEAVKLLQKDYRKDIMSRAEMPIDDLSYEDGKFFVKGKPINNLSESEKLKVSMEIAKRLNNKFKIICIDGAEKLDDESFKKLKAEVKKGDYQFFITNVHSENGIVMEKGKVKK